MIRAVKSDDFARKVTIENLPSLDIIVDEFVAGANGKLYRQPEDTEAISKFVTGQK